MWSAMGRRLICLRRVKMLVISKRDTKWDTEWYRYLLRPYPSVGNGETISPIFICFLTATGIFYQWRVLSGKRIFLHKPYSQLYQSTWLSKTEMKLNVSLLFLCHCPVAEELKSSSWNAVNLVPWEQGLRMDPATWAAVPVPPCGSASLRALWQHPPNHAPAPASWRAPSAQ